MFPKIVVPNNHGCSMVFPTKNDHFGVFWGYHHLRKHPPVENGRLMLQNVWGVMYIQRFFEKIRLKCSEIDTTWKVYRFGAGCFCMFVVSSLGSSSSKRVFVTWNPSPSASTFQG